MKIKAKYKMYGVGLTFVLSCLAKLLGALYRIPLLRIVGANAMGEFSLVFPIYAFAVTLVGSGITVNVARLVVANRYDNTKVVKKSCIIFAVISFAFTIILTVFSLPISLLTKTKSSQILLVIMSLSLPFSTLSAVFRGYFQGVNNPLLCGVSYCIEPLVKIIIGLTFAPRFGVYGIGVAVALSELVTAFFLVLSYFVKRNKTQGEKPTTSILLLPALKTAVGSAIIPLSQFFDGIIVLRLLSIRYALEFSKELLGVLSSITSLLALPSLAVNALVSTAISRFCDDKKRRKTLLLCGSVTFLCIAVFSASTFIFAPTLVSTLYPTLTPTLVTIAINLIKILAPSPLFLGLCKILTTYLQGIGKFFYPSFGVGVGVLAKTLVEFLLTYGLGIYASALGIILSNGVAFVLNVIAVIKIEKFTVFNKKLFSIIFAPIVFSVVANAFTYYSRSLPFTVIAFLVAVITLLSFLYAFVFSSQERETREKDDKNEPNETYIRVKSS